MQKLPTGKHLFLHRWGSLLFSDIDAHGLKIQGRGYGMFLPKFLGGGQGFWEKLPGGGPLILRFIAFLLTSFLKICLGVCCFIPPPPLCASMFSDLNMNNIYKM